MLGPGWDPNHLTLIVFLKKFLQVNFEKSADIKSMKSYPATYQVLVRSDF